MTDSKVELQHNTDLTKFLESGSKIAAIVAIVVYICGYLICSIFRWQFGVAQINPFKPRIIAAGSWFALLLLIPIWSAIETMGGRRVTWRFFFTILFPFWIGCCTLSFFPATIFIFNKTYNYEVNWTQVVATVISWALYTAILSLRRRINQNILPTLSACLTLFFVGWCAKNLAVAGKFIYSSLIIWFFSIGIATMMELMSYTPPKLLDTRWIKTLFAFLFYLFIFAGAFYPHIRPSWGGGEPIPVTIYFTKDSALRANSKVDALLLDEEDSGIFLTSNSDNIAIFVPKSYVSMMVFSKSDKKSALVEHEISGTTTSLSERK